MAKLEEYPINLFIKHLLVGLQRNRNGEPVSHYLDHELRYPLNHYLNKSPAANLRWYLHNHMETLEIFELKLTDACREAVTDPEISISKYQFTYLNQWVISLETSSIDRLISIEYSAILA